MHVVDFLFTGELIHIRIIIDLSIIIIAMIIVLIIAIIVIMSLLINYIPKPMGCFSELPQPSPSL